MNKFVEALKGTASLFSKEINEQGIMLMVNMLSSYKEEDLINALHKHLKSSRFFPTIADIISKIDSGHPGAEEAWAMVPKNEYESAAMSKPMFKAYGVAYPLIESDPVAARMAFKEVYEREVNLAISNNQKPEWTVSLGQDKSSREAAVRDALLKNRISEDQAKMIYPELPELGDGKNVALINEIKKMLPNFLS